MTSQTVLAVDLGAKSGRVMAVHFDGAQLSVEELHRFPNPVTAVRGTLYWDVLHLWRNIQQGIALGQAHHPAAIGVDTWALDFALLDARGSLLANPVMYRDARTEGMLEAVFARVPRREVFQQTGIQFMQINTLYQLMSLAVAGSPLLDAADTFLTIPDLLNYWLTGARVCEFTNATTTQMLNPQTGTWAGALLDALGLPTRILPEIVPPGTRLGQYEGIPVIAPATHDTGSAVAAVPAATPNFAYISSGTWSLVGLEVPQPIISDASYAANLTNEGGVAQTYRLLKNVMGLWILQQCQATWRAEGTDYSYNDLVQIARQAPPLKAIINVDDPCFLPPGDHPRLIREWCQAHGQPIPATHGEIVRCVLESLALKYRAVLATLRQVSGQQVDALHIVGGGARNALLNQFTADATGLPVVAGPIEATVLGNAAVQLIALGELDSIAQARQIIAGLDNRGTYAPQPTSQWDDAYQRMQPA